MTTVTIQPNKIVLNEVNDNQKPQEPSFRKKTNELFGQSILNALISMSLSHLMLNY